MKYSVILTSSFKKDAKRCKKRGYNTALLREAIRILSEKGMLPSSYRPHKLSGKYSDCWECHLQPDWLLVWKKNNNELILTMTATGTHDDLFR